MKGRYVQIGREIGELVERKNAAYGDSFARSGGVLRILYPDGVSPDRYDEMLAVVRILDKLFRVANEPDAFGESPFGDIAGYGILGVALAARRRALGHVRGGRAI
jgi:hypothetical protein